MFKKFMLMGLLALVGFVGAAKAQSETYVGAQFVRVNPDVRQGAFRYDGQSDSLGAVASYTNYFSKSAGLTGEVSVNFITGDRSKQLYTALGGVTLKYRENASVQPFVTGAVGIGTVHVDKRTLFIGSPAKTDTNVAYKVSTGFDLGKGNVKWRVFEAGYLQTRFFNQRQDNFVLSTGVIF